MEKFISQSLTLIIPNDPRKHELKELETKKGFIDQKAISKVCGELYCGLGLLILQTLGFIRLTLARAWDLVKCNAIIKVNVVFFLVCLDPRYLN